MYMYKYKCVTIDWKYTTLARIMPERSLTRICIIRTHLHTSCIHTFIDSFVPCMKYMNTHTCVREYIQYKEIHASKNADANNHATHTRASTRTTPNHTCISYRSRRATRCSRGCSGRALQQCACMHVYHVVHACAQACVYV